MAEMALSGREMLSWNDRTFARWMDFVELEPAVLEVPCDVYGVSDLRGLLHHVTVVELRYAQRLCGETEITYEGVNADVGGFTFAHRAAVERFERLFGDAAYEWETVIPFQTKSMGVLKASRKTVLVHSLMHSIRHYAQAAMLARQAGHKPGWPMDYLFMGVVGRE
jgi:uncharacterized damage-inducible protein DinB